jgi:tryptophan halogenase
MLKINSITVVGGGTAGWMTASTMIKAYPHISVSVIEPQGGEIIGVGESTIGGIRQWTNFIGLEDKQFLKETDGSYKLSIKFTDFYERDGESFHYPFGEPYLEQSPLQLMDWFYKKHYYPETPWDDYVRCLFPTTYLYENNKFNENNYQEFNNFNIKRDLAFHFDSAKFGVYLKNNFCVPNGVKIIDASVVNIITGENGIESLVVDNGESIT